MKSILMSYQPYWYYRIFIAKDKKIEVRKSNLEPHRNFAYCSKNKKSFNRIQFRNEAEREQMLAVMGKVGGEFVCWEVDQYDYGTIYVIPKGYYISADDLEKACLTYDELCGYGKCKTLYGLHITALKIYDKPRELGEFYSNKCKWLKSHTDAFCDCYCPYGSECFRKGKVAYQPVTRPPQSYMKVETPDWAEEDTL